MATEQTQTENLQDYEFTNTNKWDTRQLVTMALLAAIGVLLAFIQIPLIPGQAWLTYDPSNLAALVAGFAYGPAAGLAVGYVATIIHGILLADVSGTIMNLLVVTAFVWPAAMIYKKVHTFKGSLIGLGVAIVCATVMAILGNLIITPAYLGVALDAVIALILPALLPFNLAKSILNSALTLLVYKSISNLITPKKKQVKGR